MKPRRVIFEDIDAELIYRAARLGVRGLAKREQPRAELALKRFYVLLENMRKQDSAVIELKREAEIRNESLSELRRWQQTRQSDADSGTPERREPRR